MSGCAKSANMLIQELKRNWKCKALKTLPLIIAPYCCCFSERLPEILYVHLKRFNSAAGKLEDSICFGEVLELEDCQYELSSVVIHIGSSLD